MSPGATVAVDVEEGIAYMNPCPCPCPCPCPPPPSLELQAAPKREKSSIREVEDEFAREDGRNYDLLARRSMRA